MESRDNAHDLFVQKKLNDESKWRRQWLARFRNATMILVFIVVFSWCVFDSYMNVFVLKQEEFLLYIEDGRRRNMYLLMSLTCELARLISTIFFAAALCKFWSVFK